MKEERGNCYSVGVISQQVQRSVAPGHVCFYRQVRRTPDAGKSPNTLLRP